MVDFCARVASSQVNLAVRVSPGEKSRMFAFLQGSSNMFAFLPKGNPSCSHVSRRDSEHAGFLPGRNVNLLDFSQRNASMVYFCVRVASSQVNLAVRASPREKSKMFAFLPGRNPTCSHFSWGEIQHVRISPGEKCEHAGFRPGRSVNFLDFSWRNVSMVDFCARMAKKNKRTTQRKKKTQETIRPRLRSPRHVENAK